MKRYLSGHCIDCTAPTVLNNCVRRYPSRSKGSFKYFQLLRRHDWQGRKIVCRCKEQPNDQQPQQPTNNGEQDYNKNSDQNLGDKNNSNQQENENQNSGPFNIFASLFANPFIRDLSSMIMSAYIVMSVLQRLSPKTQTNMADKMAQQQINVPYSQFIQGVYKNQIDYVEVRANYIRYGVKKQKYKQQFSTRKPSDLTAPYDKLFSSGVRVIVHEEMSWQSRYLPYMVSLAFVLAIFNIMGQRFAGLLMPDIKKQNSPTSPPKVKFNDVAGVDEAKEELLEIVEFLKCPARFRALGAVPPAGILLTGPPGTGKTLLAKAIAGESGVPFYSVSGSEFVELFVGMGASRVRELFAAARKNSPSIVFIDEVDAVAKARDNKLRGPGNDEREQTLNQLLTELDGFDPRAEDGVSVVCIAATNRPEVLDTALLRPGRFDRLVAVGRPDKRGREHILNVHIKNKQVKVNEESRAELASMLAARTTGFTGADLAAMINEAALLAARHYQGEVTMQNFDAAILRTVAGIEKKSSVLLGEEKLIIARHEAGHALVSAALQQLLPYRPSLAQLSIIPRSSGALGMAYTPPNGDDRYLLLTNDIRAELSVLYGGRAAEEMACSCVSTGAEDDIRRATELAHKYVNVWGLGQRVGAISVSGLTALTVDESGGLVGNGESQLAQQATLEVTDLLRDALNAARAVLRANEAVHKEVADKLSEMERLEGTLLHQLLDRVIVPDELKAFIFAGSSTGLVVDSR